MKKTYKKPFAEIIRVGGSDLMDGNGYGWVGDSKNGEPIPIIEDGETSTHDAKGFFGSDWQKGFTSADLWEED